jgi:hypothetical protein
MTRSIYPAFVASLGAIAVMLAASETFARSGTTSRGGFTSTHAMSSRAMSSHAMVRPSATRGQRHHRINTAGFFWPAGGDGFYGTPNGELPAEVEQRSSSDVHYTYDVPWDWAHRYPPILTPSGQPYVPSCPTQVVTVPGHDGKRQSVNITQCF